MVYKSDKQTEGQNLNPPYLLYPDLILSIQLLPSKILRPAKKQKITCQGIIFTYSFI